MNLNNQQFLKIRATGSIIDFEIYELPESGKRAKRWHLEVPVSRFWHTRESNLKHLFVSIATVKMGFMLEYYTK